MEHGTRGLKTVSSMPFSSQPLLKRIIALFPGIRSAPYQQQLKLGRDALGAALKDPSLVMVIKRDVAALRDEMKRGPPARK